MTNEIVLEVMPVFVSAWDVVDFIDADGFGCRRCTTVRNGHAIEIVRSGRWFSVDVDGYSRVCRDEAAVARFINERIR